MIVLPSMTFTRCQISPLTTETPGTAAMSSPQSVGSREKMGIGAPGCITTNPGMSLNVSEIIASRPRATENSPTIPAIATVSPNNDNNDRIGRLSRFRNASLSINEDLEDESD